MYIIQGSDSGRDQQCLAQIADTQFILVEWVHLFIWQFIHYTRNIYCFKILFIGETETEILRKGWSREERESRLVIELGAP